VVNTLNKFTVTFRGPDSSVGTTNDYGLEGPGWNPCGNEIFRPSRPALEPTHPPVKWVPGLSRGRVGRDLGLTSPPPSSAEGPRKE
jgi:hypothetical protein